MIELYRHAVCEPCAGVEAALAALVAAHQVIIVGEGQSAPGLPAGQPLPAIVDGDQVVSGDKEIAAYLEELDKVLTTWRKFQVDACYVS